MWGESCQSTINLNDCCLRSDSVYHARLNTNLLTVLHRVKLTRHRAQFKPKCIALYHWEVYSTRKEAEAADVGCSSSKPLRITFWSQVTMWDKGDCAALQEKEAAQVVGAKLWQQSPRIIKSPGFHQQKGRQHKYHVWVAITRKVIHDCEQYVGRGAWQSGSFIRLCVQIELLFTHSHEMTSGKKLLLLLEPHLTCQWLPQEYLDPQFTPLFKTWSHKVTLCCTVFP